MFSFNLTTENAFAATCDEKAEQTIEKRANLGEKNLASLESFQHSVAELTSKINSTLATFSMLTDYGGSWAQGLSESNNKEQFQKYFLKIKQDYGAVATIAESIAECTRLIVGTKPKC